jgi:opacity protein-like surface antigen
MRRVTRAFALFGGLAACGLLLSPTVNATDLEPVIEAHGLQWYGSLFGGPKWGNGDVDVKWEHENDPCDLSSLACVVQPLIYHEGEFHGEINDGFIFGGTVGAKLSEHFRGEIEISAARLETQSETFEYVAYGLPPTGTTYKAVDGDHLREVFILANAWFDYQLSSRFCSYIGGGAGVAHVDADFGVDPFAPGQAQVTPFSASIEAEDWAFAYQLGAGLLIGLSKHVGLDVGYRFKAINNVEVGEPEYCGGAHCSPPIAESKATDDFDLKEHAAHIGLIITF